MFTPAKGITLLLYSSLTNLNCKGLMMKMKIFRLINE